MPTYNKTSVYSNTNVHDYYLDLMVNRPIPTSTTDIFYEITETYNLRPDLLAFDMYDESDLWWVFAQRNPDVLKNPLIDFSTGTKIYVPELETLRAVLGF